VIALDVAGRILNANLDARQVLDAGHSLRVRDSRLAFANSCLNARLTRLLAAHACAPTDAHGFVARLQPTNGEGLLRVLVTPLRNGQANSDIAVLVFIFDTHRERVISHQVLRDLYGLTHAQCVVTAHLFEGRSVEQTAKLLGVSVNTARSHLKRVFTKCEVQSQGELLYLLSLGPRSI
jgi:DNA-binding CsgD family transcriptional regulator